MMTNSVRSFFSLIVVESSNWFHSFIFSIPGKTGSLVRFLYLKHRLGNCGTRSSFDIGITITGYKNIVIGDHCTFSKRCFIAAHSGGHISIGDNFSVNVNSYIGAADGGNIIIGNNVLIAQNVVLRASNHYFNNITIPINQQGHSGGEIVIEDDCWIGANVVVTPNVRIGRHSIVGAGAVVTSDIEPYSIVAGVPAKLIRKRN